MGINDYIDNNVSNERPKAYVLGVLAVLFFFFAWLAFYKVGK